MGEIRASADESEPLVVTCVKMCMVQRKMELRDRVKDGQNDDKGDLKLLPCLTLHVPDLVSTQANKTKEAKKSLHRVERSIPLHQITT